MEHVYRREKFLKESLGEREGKSFQRSLDNRGGQSFMTSNSEL